MSRNIKAIILIFVIFITFVVVGCNRPKLPAAYPVVDRETRIPLDINKRCPETDHHPPLLHSEEFEQPRPLPHPVNTAGAGDCPVISSDGQTLYFFFTPDVRVPPEKQLLDQVSGTYVTHKNANGWSIPERVWLEDPGKVSLDSTLCIQGSEMWFCSAREGYTGVIMFTAEHVVGQWVNWQYIGDLLMKEIQIGEVYVHGDELYFHSDRAGGKGGLDLWVTSRAGDSWSDPLIIEPVNTVSDEGFPSISMDGQEG